MVEEEISALAEQYSVDPGSQPATITIFGTTEKFFLGGGETGARQGTKSGTTA